MERWALLSVLVVSLALSASGHPGKDKNYLYDYQNDEEYHEYVNDYGADEGEDEEEEKHISRNPKFVSTSKSLMVNQGDTIKLPCIVDKLEGFVLLWKRGKDILAVGENIVDRSEKYERLQLENKSNGNELVIPLADVGDEGEYICQVSSFDPTELKHHVKIRIAPKVETIPKSGYVKVKAGEPLELGCNILQGSPTPNVVWTRKERPMPTGEHSVAARSIVYPVSNRHHSGVYTCSADNGFGEPVNGTIRVDVQHAPVIEQEQMFIHTRDGDETEVTCIVHSSPRSTVTWYKNGRFLDEDTNVISHRGNRHTLLVTSLTGSTLGKYECRAVNELGEDMKMIEVSGKASPAEFKSPAKGKHKDSYTLQWLVQSITEVTDFTVEYKEEAEAEWGTKVAKAQRVDQRYYEGEVDIAGLRPGTRYVARVAARNSFGVSDPSLTSFGFVTMAADGGHPTSAKPPPPPTIASSVTDPETALPQRVEDGSGASSLRRNFVNLVLVLLSSLVLVV